MKIYHLYINYNFSHAWKGEIRMKETKEIAFLCRRLKELREKNDCTMEGMVKKLNSINFTLEINHQFLG